MAAPDIAPRHVVFRGAVIIGCVALLLGVAGVFYFHGVDHDRAGARPRDAATVIVRGLESLEGVRVRARWRAADGAPLAETGGPAGEAGHWLFRRAPEGAPLTLEILRRDGGAERTLQTQAAVLTRGAHFEVWVRGER